MLYTTATATAANENESESEKGSSVSGDVEKGQGGDAAQSEPPPPPLDLDGLERLHEAATPGPWEAGRAWINAPRECWIQHDDGSVSNTLAWMGLLNGEDRETATAKLIVAMHAALPALLAAARERDALRAKIAQHNVWHSENMNDAARLAAEVERLKARLEAAHDFDWTSPSGDRWTIMQCQSNDMGEDCDRYWRVENYTRVEVIGSFDSLDAAWSAAEAHAAAQAAERKGGTAHD